MRTRISVFATLWLVASMAVLGPGAGAESPKESSPASEKTGGEAVGASVVHPASWTVEREPYTYEGSLGYTLWRPEPADGDHGGTPAVRVALAYGLEPGQIEAEVRDTLAYYDDLPVSRRTVDVAEKGYRGVAVGPIPGSTPATRVFVPVSGRVYRIDVYAEEPGEEGLDADDERLLSGIRFEPPSRTVGSLDLPGANSEEALYAPTGPPAEEAFKTDPAIAAAGSDDGLRTLGGGSGERRLRDGCWRADPAFYVQTQHGRYANRRAGDGIPTGFSRVGRPNYWDEYSHGRLGYGRCTKDYYTNDKYAVDYRLTTGDWLFSPFACGRVTFAGRNTTHKDYGIFVSIKSCSGKYTSLSGHLSALHPRLDKGDPVDRDTVIGYAGKSGGGRIPVGRPHLHQAFYRYAEQNPDRSPYGGAGLKVNRHHFVRGKGGVYTFGWERRKGVIAKGSLVSN